MYHYNIYRLKNIIIIFVIYLYTIFVFRSIDLKKNFYEWRQMLVFFINVYKFQAATTPIFLNCLLICCCGLYPPHVFGRRNNTPHDICVFKWSNCSAGLRLSIRCLFSTLFVFNQWNVYCVWVYDSPRANGWSTFLPINMTMPRERLCVLSNWIIYIYTNPHIYIFVKALLHSLMVKQCLQSKFVCYWSLISVVQALCPHLYNTNPRRSLGSRF